MTSVEATFWVTLRSYQWRHLDRCHLSVAYICDVCLSTKTSKMPKINWICWSILVFTACVQVGPTGPRSREIPANRRKPPGVGPMSDRNARRKMSHSLKTTIQQRSDLFFSFQSNSAWISDVKQDKLSKPRPGLRQRPNHWRIQTPPFCLGALFEKTYFENMSLRFLAEQGASWTQSRNYRNLVRDLT